MGLCLQRTKSDEATISGFPGGFDMRLLANYASTPTIIFGPGSIKQAHSIDEFVRVKELMLSAKIFALGILDWCNKLL